MRSYEWKAYVSSSCTVHFSEGSTADLHCGHAENFHMSPHTGDHSKENPLVDCLWSLNQSPAAPESHYTVLNHGQKTHFGCSSPFEMWPSY